MTVERFEVRSREPYEDGRRFGEVGAYIRIDAVAHYAVDPAAAANTGIVDLDRVPRDADGMVRFSGDVVVLAPAEPSHTGPMTLLDVPNRGRVMMNTLFNRATPEIPPTRAIPLGDAFLQERGFPLVWCGWQWDVRPGPGRLAFDAPRALATGGGPLTGPMQLRLQLNDPASWVPLTDHHSGPPGAHVAIPTADPHDPDATLRVRDGLHGQAHAVPRHRWRFAAERDGRVVDDAAALWLDGGFEPGRIYDLVYRAAEAPVAGAGLLAVRDLGAFLRTDRADNPLAAVPRPVLVHGISQCSRFLRTLLHLGLHVDEAGAPAFDAVLGLVGGGRRGEFNFRYAQPSVQPTPGFGFAFPFADLSQHDPRTGLDDGLLDALTATAAPPRVMFVDSAAEYWRGDASLAHTSVADGTDVADAPFVRRYLYAGTQHGAGVATLDRVTAAGARAANHLGIVDYTPLYRATLMNLVAWACEGVEPPPLARACWHSSPRSA